MANTVIITITDNSTRSTQDIKDKIRVATHRTLEEVNSLQTYFSSMASGVNPCSMDVQVYSGTPGTTAGNASGTITCASVSVTQATATVTAASVSAADTVTVNGTVFTAVNGGSPTSVQFDMSGTDNQTAANLAAAVTAHATVGLIITGAAVATNVCTFTAVKSGTGGNAYTLATSNNTRLAKSGTTLSGGAADTATVQGITLTATNVAATSTEWVIGGTDSTAGTALAARINANATTSTYVSAAAVLGVVTVSALQRGVQGNLLTISSSNNTRLAVSGATLSGGTNDTANVYNFNS